MWYARKCSENFNPRSHERSDRERAGVVALDENFNPRSHERSDMDCTLSHTNLDGYFNPRSHERSDWYLR